MQNWKIDPGTGDYVMDSGSPVETNSLTIPAYVRLKTQRTRWLYAPDNQFGSDFYTVKKRPAENANLKLEDIAGRALKPLLDDGRAKQITVDITENTRNAAGMDAQIIDASGEIENTTFKGLF